MTRGWVMAATLSMSAALAQAGALQEPAPPSLGRILKAAAAYLDRFERDFAVVVSDEDYHQQIGTDLVARTPKQWLRDTKSEMVFLWIPDQQLWITARNVLVVDGKPVPDSEGRLQQALINDAGRAGRVRQIRSDTARYNIGGIYRNFNDPTFVLQFLAARMQDRFRWRLGATERIDGVQTWRVDFEERERPSLIRREGISVPSTGAVWLEPDTGVVRKTHLVAVDAEKRTTATIDVSFRHHEKLSLNVPVRMEERYEERAMIRGRLVEANPIIATAEYSNYRRFETSARIVN